MTALAQRLDRLRGGLSRAHDDDGFKHQELKFAGMFKKQPVSMDQGDQ